MDLHPHSFASSIGAEKFGVHVLVRFSYSMVLLLGFLFYLLSMRL